MKHRWLILALFLCAVPAMAEDPELLIPPDDDGCQSYLPYAWVTINPGETWVAPADLTRCSSEEMGSFLYYAYVASRSNSRTVTLKDKLVLKATDLVTGEVFSYGGRRGDPQRIVAKAYGPCMFELSVENHGRSAQKIRVTWNWMGY
jgi:hypothetical protein